ncbi:GerMN domain-containing protein [Shouchella shacheensis]|uniref:GerMN domain-containing protein n=1 Tax=Shouchella shacheensis TaxID=1649580 RepID=UPI0007404DCD|nr:GerMN domain-containing protein [Shouchella shacheensis]
MRKLVGISVPFIVILTLATGCSFGAKDAVTDLDDPPVNYIEEGEDLGLEGEEGTESEREVDEGNEEGAEEGEEESEEADEDQEPAEEGAEANERELYLFDANGMVVPQTLPLPKSDGVMQQSLEYLVQDGPVQELLPSGFQAVLPAGTEVSVNLMEDEETAVADFSPEFNEYNPEHEQEMLQAITWTLTQFDGVEQIKLLVNGHELKEMPHSKTPIGDSLSRANGINLESNQVTDMTNSSDVTVYFLGSEGEGNYYVPVTRRVENSEDHLATAIEQLINGPALGTSLVTEMNQNIELLEEPTVNDGTVTLNFNESILTEHEATAVSSSVLDMLALTLTEQEGVSDIAIEVDGEANVMAENGKEVESVVRPDQINPHPL